MTFVRPMDIGSALLAMRLLYQEGGARRTLEGRVNDGGRRDAG